MRLKVNLLQSDDSMYSNTIDIDLHYGNCKYHFNAVYNQKQMESNIENMKCTLHV